MTICFLMPFYHANLPTGGLKIVLQYANELVSDGHIVKVVYPYRCCYNVPFSSWQRIKDLKNYYRDRKKWNSSDNWFEKFKNVQEIETYSLNKKWIPKADIYIATGVETSDYVKDYSGKNFYLIQGYENWGRSDDELIKTYHYPLHKIAVSKWLQKRVKAEGIECDVVQNGFELDKFYVLNRIENRESTNLCMLYHRADIKNSLLGFRALELVHQKYPSTIVNIFGGFERPANLPEWYHYTQQPTESELLKIYNDSSIFLGTSNCEGWGLTIGEAMLCGETVVCTNIEGYKEMVIDGVNGLLSPIGDSEKLANNIIRLIEDSTLRIKLAKKASEDLKKFSFDDSYEKLKTILQIPKLS